METTSRSAIISLLSEACELEHGLACSYLYAAFSLKQSTYENDLTWEQLQSTRKWAGQLYFIASQEMFHLSQAWNLLTAIGGTPYYMRPNFPQGHRYYPLDLPLLLEPFGKKALKRFIFYELPEHVSDVEYLEKEFGISKDQIDQAFTVGKLYAKILEGILSIPEKDLFIGNNGLQVGTETCHFNEIVKVIDRRTAEKAILAITEQGEGTLKDQDDCHYGLFINIQKEYDFLEEEAKRKGLTFNPARKIISNPVPAFNLGQSPKGASCIENGYSSAVATLFDKIYSLMLRLLQYVFQCGPLTAQAEGKLSNISIQLMTRVLKPIGEALTLLPATNTRDGKNCGPAFGLYRHVSFPADFTLSKIIIVELLTEITNTGKDLANHINAPVPLKEGIEKMDDITRQFKLIL
jgi:hypothetical protein